LTEGQKEEEKEEELYKLLQKTLQQPAFSTSIQYDMIQYNTNNQLRNAGLGTMKLGNITIQ